jgi:hypothetical protein
MAGTYTIIKFDEVPNVVPYCCGVTMDRIR